MSRAAVAAALALCLLGLARAQAPPGFDCASLPSNWGQDQDQNNNNNNNNDNEAWQALATAPGQNVFSQIYNTFLSRYSNSPPSGWEPSCSWTAAAVGCQQNYGWGEWTGMNQALQVNYTCGNNVLGMIVDVNYNDNYVNVDDLDVFALWVDGKLQAGSDIDEASLSWWEGNDDVWGQFYNLMNENQDNNNNNDNNGNNNNNQSNDNQNNQNQNNDNQNQNNDNNDNQNNNNNQN